jgi:hypothetical protein
MILDRFGRLHCGCGRVMMRAVQDFGDEGTEVSFVCMSCFKSGADAWISSIDLDSALSEVPVGLRNYRPLQLGDLCEYFAERC